MTTESQTKSEQEILRSLQDLLVTRAEQLVRELELPKGDGLSKGRTQASRALEVAQTAKSLSVFVNWLRYQAGRERSAEFWSRSAGGHRSLAKGVVLNLGEFRQRITDEMLDAPVEQQNELVMQATTRYLGYFRRALIGADFLDDIMIPELKQDTTHRNGR